MNKKNNSLIIQEESVGRAKLLLSQPRTEGHETLVYLSHRGGPIDTKGRPLTLGQILWGRFYKVVRVDTSEHSIDLDGISVPGRDNKGDFLATVSVRYRVSSPTEIIGRLRESGADVLAKQVRETVFREIRKFETVDIANAEENLRKMLVKERFDSAFQILGCTVQLAVDKDLSVYHRKIGDMEREKRVAELEHELVAMRSEQERIRLQDQLTFTSRMVGENNWASIVAASGLTPEKLETLAGRLQEEDRALFRRNLEVLHNQNVQGLIDEDQYLEQLRVVMSSTFRQTPPDPARALEDKSGTTTSTSPDEA